MAFNPPISLGPWPRLRPSGLLRRQLADLRDLLTGKSGSQLMKMIYTYSAGWKHKEVRKFDFHYF